MKKSLLSILTLALVAVGCQNYDDQFDSLNKDIASLAATVAGLDTGVAAQVTAIGAQITALETKVNTLSTTVGTSDLTAADLTTSLAGVLTDIAAVQTELSALDTEVGTSIAGVVTQVTTLAAELSDVAAAQLTTAQVEAIVAVTDQTSALADVQTALDELLASEASVNAQVNIRNQAELDYAKTLIETDGTPESYIINGGLTVDATGAYTAGTDFTAEINAITARITSVIGNVTITSASDIATGTIDLARLTYVSGGFKVAGHFNPDVSILTSAVTVEVPINSAYAGNFTLSNLTSAAGGLTLVDDTDASAVSPTSVDVSACIGCGTVVTAGTTLDLRYAAVNLGSGLPAATTIVGSLISTSVAPYTGSIKGMADATSGATGDISINSLTVTASTIEGNNITLDNGGATSAFGVSVINATGNIQVDAVTLNFITDGLMLISNTLSAKAGSVGTITLGAETIYEGTITAASTGTIDASSFKENALGALSFTATDVTLTAMVTNTAALTIVGDQDIQVPNLESSVGAINATVATVFYAPKLVTDGAIDLEEGSTLVDGAVVTVGSLAAIADLADRVNINSLTITKQGQVTLNLSTFVLMETLAYAAPATAAGTAQANDLTYLVETAASSLTSIDFTGNGGISALRIGAPNLTAISTVGLLRSLTVSGTASGAAGGVAKLTAITIGNTGIGAGDAGTVSITNTGIATLDLSGWNWIQNINVQGNVSMTTMNMPTGVTTATSVQGQVNKTVTIVTNGLTGSFSQGVTQTSAVAFEETSVTATGLTNAKTWLTWLTNESTAGGVTYTIEIDVIDADIAAAITWLGGAGVALTSATGVWDATSAIDIAAELALLPN